MKRTKLFSILFIVICLLSVSLSVCATGLEENLSFTVEASASTVLSNDTLFITVSIDHNDGFKFAQLNMVYDATQLTYVSHDDTVCQIESTAKDNDGNAIKPTVEVRGKNKTTLAIGSMQDGVNKDPETYYHNTGKVVVIEFKVAEGLANGTEINFAVEVKNPALVVDPNMTYDYTFACGSTTVTVGEPGGDVCEHVEEIIPAVPATCTATGLTEGKKCSACGEILVAQTETEKLPHNEEVIPAVPGTCQSTGKTEGKKCADCGEILVAPKDDETLGSHVEEVIPAVPGTCQIPGLTEGKKCSVCGEILVAQQESPMAEHAWVIAPGKEATCTAPGLTEGKKCSLCDEEVPAEVIAAMGHNEVIVEGQEATCTAPGMTEGKKCSRCELVIKEQTEIPALNHSFVEIPAQDPTCTAAGTTAGIWCTRCELVTLKPEEVPALNHDYVAVVTDPTCIAEGFTTHTCSRCQDSYTDSVTEKAEHTPVDVNGKDATCTETGLTAGKKCSVCEFVIEAQTEIPMLDHTEETIPAKTPTCTETGLTEGKKCSVCGAVTEEQKTVEKLPHDEIVIAGYPASYGSDGLTDGKKCSVCGKVTVQQTVIPAFKHTIEIIPGKAATCTESGLTEGKKCIGCCYGAVILEQEVIPALGHDYKAEVTAPSCTKEGFTTYTCSRCTDVYTGDVTAKTPHNEIAITGKAATCTATGLTEGTKCANCGETVKAQEVIPMTEHTFGEWEVVKEATATEDGSKSRACSTCGHSEEEAIPATGEVIDTEPTEPETKPTEPETKPTVPSGNGNGDNNNSNMVLIIAVIALFIAAAAIIVLLILKKK